MSEIKKQYSVDSAPESDMKSLYIIGGVAALIAGALFRRNIAAEIGIFSSSPPPESMGEWFEILQKNRLLGLAYLNIFDVVNYALLIFMFLALYTALKGTNKGLMKIAMVSGFMGIAVYLATNTAFSMVSLSEQYAAATEAQRNMLLGSGQALLAIGRFSGHGGQPGSGGYASLLLVAIAGLITSVVMLRSGVFRRITAYAGILAGALDLGYCIAYAFIPVKDSGSLALFFIPAAGLFLMAWHIMVGWKLCRLGRLEGKKQKEAA